ncbi:MAG: ester cyclase [Thermoplasmata archaeon]
MSLEENLKVLDAAERALQTRDWDGFDATHAESVVVYSPTTPEPTKGRQSHREALEDMVTMMPDMKLERVRAFGSGDWVCAELVMTGTNTGPVLGPGSQEIPPTNRPVRLDLVTIGKIVNGEIAEEHVYFDRMGFMAQLGLLPER